MSDIKNPQAVKRQLDEVDNALSVLQSTVERGMKIDTNDFIERLKRMRQKVQFAIDNING